MKCLLGTALAALVLLVTGCGDATSDAASQPTDPDPSSSATTTSTPPADGPLSLAIVSQTAVGGHVDLDAVPIDDEAARQRFTAQFRRPSMDTKVARAVASASVPEGYVVMGAVVALGCDVPPGVTITQSPDGWVVTPDPVPSPLTECFAPVTTVAVVAVPA